MSAAADVACRLREQEWIDDPFLGPVPPEEFEAGTAIWPESPRWESVRTLAVTSQGPRTVSEFEFSPADSSDPVLPVAIVWDESGGARRARVYFNKGLLGSDQVRPPVIPPDPDMVLHPTMSRYASALRAGDEQGLLDALEPGLRVTGPMGEFKAADVRSEFAKGMASVGGVPLQYVVSTDDGTRAALEFISWRIRPHAGVGVYVRAASGRIAEFRAYEGPVRLRPGGAGR